MWHCMSSQIINNGVNITIVLENKPGEHNLFWEILGSPKINVVIDINSTLLSRVHNNRRELLLLCTLAIMLFIIYN